MTTLDPLDPRNLLEGFGEQPLVVPPGRIGRRGMRGPFGGRAAVLDNSREYRGTTRQVCGFWPFVAGSGTPLVGAHMGTNMDSGATMHCDPIAWFEQANRLSSPSMFTLALNGLGKSTIQRHMMVGLDFRGVITWVLGDTKGEYTAVAAALAGAVLQLGPGLGTLNPMDLGAMGEVAARLTGEAQRKLRKSAIRRRSNMVSALLAIARRAPTTGDEDGLVDRAVNILAQRDLGRPALLSDLIRLLEECPDELMVMVVATSERDYRRVINPLLRTLNTLIGGPLGEIFNAQTSIRFPLDRPVVVDLSQINATDKTIEGAVLLACWAEGFATLEAADALAESRGERPRHYYLVLDELWRILRAGVGLVDRIDELTRLNRTFGVGQSMTTHSVKDLVALRDQEDRDKAKGFIDRSGFVICGGLPKAELDALGEIIRFSDRERQRILSWSEMPPHNDETQELEAPPGRGKFLIKVKGQAGIPVDIHLTDVELALNNTNQKWANGSRRSVPAVR